MWLGIVIVCTLIIISVITGVINPDEYFDNDDYWFLDED